MYDINSTREYRETVSMIYEEYKEEIETNARGVASAHIAQYEIFDSQIVVVDSAEYCGAASEAIEEGLNPYDVIRYSETRIPKETVRGGDTAHGRAVQCLARDLQEH